MTNAYAYINEAGEIDIRTVSPTELGALVNTIVIMSERRLWPQDYWSRELIDSALIHATNGKGAVVKVYVSQGQ